MNLFESHIKRIQELSGILNENNLLSDKIIASLIKKFNSSDEDLINKLHIFSLFKERKPFYQIKDVMQLQSIEQLNDLFKKWYEDTINELIKLKPFVQNKQLAETYLNAYVANIKSLKNQAKPFSLKDDKILEKTFVDVILNNNWIKNEKNTSIENPYGIDKPHDEDIVFEDDKIIIMKAPTKAKCITYGYGESWCISQTDINYYVTYRIKNGATIYFVYQKNLSDTDNEKKLVVLYYRNLPEGGEGYGLADRSNSGGRSGGPDVAMSWSALESEIPNLRGKKNYFEYRHVSDSEKKYEEMLNNEITESNLEKTIEKKIEGLVIDGAQVTKEEFVRDYVSIHRITDEQFKSLSQPMITTLIEIGYGFSDRQIGMLSSADKVRTLVVRINAGHSVGGDFGLLNRDEQDRVLNNIKADKLTDSNVFNLLHYSEDKNATANNIIQIKGDKLTDNMIFNLFHCSFNKDKFADKIIKLGIADKLSDYNMEYLLLYSNDKDELQKSIDKIKAAQTKSINETRFTDYIKRIIKEELDEDRFIFNDLNQQEQEDVFTMFKVVYEKNTGTSWDINKFRGRASSWTFYGDIKNGYVAVRKQKGGMNKLVGMAGKSKDILRGMDELVNEGGIIWGMMDKRFVDFLVQKYGFISPPSWIIKILIKLIPSNVFGGVDFDVNNDGSITMKYSDVGDSKKYFVANTKYFQSVIKLDNPIMNKIPGILKNQIVKWIDNL